MKNINKQAIQQFHFTDALTMANIIPVLKESFPELKEQLLELEDDASLAQDNEYNQFVFSYLFNPFLKNFLSDPGNVLIGQRLFLFLEKMAQSPDFQVKHILALVIFTSLNPDELAVAKKYMGPKTTARNLSMWNREEFEKRMKTEGIKVVCWGYSKQAANELECRLNFRCDLDTRSFIEEIGNVTIDGTSNAGRAPSSKIIVADASHIAHARNCCNPFCDLCQQSDLLRKSLAKDTVVEIMYYAGMHYVLHKNGFIKAYDNSLLDQAAEVYTSLAHLVEELIKNIHLVRKLSNSYRSLTRQQQLFIRRNRPKLTIQQRENYLNRIDNKQINQETSPSLHDILSKRLPELPVDLSDDWGCYPFGWVSSSDLPDYSQCLLDEVFNPFLKLFLSYDPGDTMVGKHLFYVLEIMAQSPNLKSKLALMILDSLSTVQLEIAKKYMGPRTQEVLKDLEEYF